MRAVNLYVILIIILYANAYAVCEYTPAFNISNDRVSTLFPQAGDEEKVWFTIESGEVYTGMLEIYLEKEGVIYPLKEERVYIVPGNTSFEYDLKVPAQLGPGVYLLYIKMDGFEHAIPLTINNGENASVWVEENEENISVHAPVQSSVKIEKKYVDGRSENKKYTPIPSENGVLISEKKCTDCKMDIYVGYGDVLARVERVYGRYEEPYVKVVELKREKLVLETCAPSSYTVNVGGEEKKVSGAVRIEKSLDSGYETVDVRLEDKGVILERTIDLGAFTPKNVTIDVKVSDGEPLIVEISARDEFGRDAESEGEIAISNGKGGTIYESVKFRGNVERKYYLAKGEYTVSYNGVSAKGSASREEVKEEVVRKSELIPADLLPLMGFMLVVAVIVLIIVWIKKWRRNI